MVNGPIPIKPPEMGSDLFALSRGTSADTTALFAAPYKKLFMLALHCNQVGHDGL